MPKSEPVQPKRPAHYLWAVLIARIYEVFPLLCPICGGQMRLIAFITEGTQIRKILDYIGVDSDSLQGKAAPSTSLPPDITLLDGVFSWQTCHAGRKSSVHTGFEACSKVRYCGSCG